MKSPEPTLPACRPRASTRRQVLTDLCCWTSAPLLLSACGGGTVAGTTDGTQPVQSTNGGTADPARPPVVVAPPAGSAVIARLKASLARPALRFGDASLNVSQTLGNGQSDSTLGPTAVVMPTPRGFAVNPNPSSLADIPAVWGWQRSLWTRQTPGYIGWPASHQSWFTPVSRNHPAATANSTGVCGLHFRFDGRRFEVLFAGTDVSITLIADGRYLAPSYIRTTLTGGVPGKPLNEPNAYVTFDFGSRAVREISFYSRSSQGPCALAIAATDSISPWDLSAEASFAAMCDSYGGAPSVNWGISGPFWEAAAQLGIMNLDIDTVGGTGYAPNNTNEHTRNPGNTFTARLASVVNGQPDLFFTSGGINDNNSQAALPLFASAAAARQSFESGVVGYYRELRRALPNAVLAAMGPWAPREISPPDPVALSKADFIKSSLQAVGGPWIYLDNLRGGWSNSAGFSGGAGNGPWQTGTGRSGAPTGQGNGDTFLSADGVHPTAAGSLGYGTRIADDLRQALLRL